MRKRSCLAILLFVFFTIISCSVPDQTPNKDIGIDFTQVDHQKIWNFKDTYQIDSLIHYLSDQDPNIRYLSAIALGSIQDPASIPPTALLLKDPIPEVRSAAAFALGQIGDASAENLLTSGFDRLDSLNRFQASNASILEAVGKIAGPKSLEAICDISTYKVSDSLLVLGQAKSIFQFGRRDLYSDKSINLAFQFLTNDQYNLEAKRMMSLYLQRTPHTYFEEKSSNLIQAFNSNSDPVIKTSLAACLGKAKSQDALNLIRKELRESKSESEKIYLLSSLQYFPYDSVHIDVYQRLRDNSTKVREAAADFYSQFGKETYGTQYYRMHKEEFSPMLKIKLLSAANRHTPLYYGETHRAINFRLKKAFEESLDPMERVEILKGLSFYRWNYKFILENGIHAKAAPVRTASSKALYSIFNAGNFRSFFGGSYRRVRQEIADSLKVILLSADDGPIYESAPILNIKDLALYRIFENNSFLDTALNNLVLPQQMETFYVLNQNIRSFRNQPSQPNRKPQYNHPIQWSKLSQIQESNTIRIQTSKGDIDIQMLPELAPGSVINFIELVEKKFYNEKTWHRVVPNFVIQTGCTRGDGYGSLNYTIRSEFSPQSYKTGYVGMASAGKDTESTQFFITHRPTPHLDGRYTIFAKVINGMDVVNQIEQGDRILTVSII